jgi:integrase
MPVRKRNGHWYYDFAIRGVRYRGAIPEARTKYDAQQAEMRERDKVFEGTYGFKKNSISFREFVNSTYKAWAQEHRVDYKKDLSKLKPLLDYFGDERLVHVSAGMIEEYKRERRKAQSCRKTPLAPATINRELVLLSKIYSLAIERNELDSKPFKKVVKLPTDGGIIRYLKDDEEERLMGQFVGRRAHLRPIVVLALQTGMRRGEILSLRKDQVDFERDQIHLFTSRKLGVKTKSDRYRTVPMTPEVKELLEQLVQRNDSEYVFVNGKTGRPLRDVKTGFRSALKEAGIKNARFHDLRHTAGTRMAENPNVPLNAVQEVLGHADIRTTMQYAHATDESKRRAIEALRNRVTKTSQTNQSRTPNNLHVTENK